MVEESRPVSRRDLRPVIRKLEVVLGEALGRANKSGVGLPMSSLVLVIDEAVKEASDMEHRARFPQTVEGVFLSGIYDELVQQPSNIFDIVTRADGKSYYVPLSSGGVGAVPSGTAEVAHGGPAAGAVSGEW